MSKTTIDANWFGHRLRELRTASSLDRHKLADLAGISHETVAKLEQGTYVAKWTTVCDLCTALGITAEEFQKKPSRTDPLTRPDPKPLRMPPDSAPERHKEAYRLRSEGLSVNDVAGKLGISRQQVYAILQRYYLEDDK